MDPTAVRIAAVREVGPSAIALELAVPAEFSARPGQFVKLAADLDGRETRFYSVSSPTADVTAEVTIEVDPDGALGPWLADREVGDTVTLSGPFGNAYYEDESRVVVLAGGPGIGPSVGVAERALADGGEAAVVYRDDAPIHEARLEALSAAGASVFVLEEDASMTRAAAAALTGGDGEQVFVYGFADFLDLATDAVAAAGGRPDEAKMENFG